MANVNSFAENMQQLTETVNDALSLISGYGTASTSNSATVDVKLSSGETVSLPSYQNLTKRVERAEQTISSFVKGSGVVEVDDGSYRKIKAQAVPRPPESISKQFNVTTFTTDKNWFFENMMFPKIVVSLDLKGSIDDNSDRVYVNRIILDSTNQDAATLFNNDLQNNPTISYPALIALLNSEGISYSEDTDIVNLPLSYEKYYGEFTIEKIVLENSGIKNTTDKLWYYLDTINYKQVDENGITISSAYQLSKGDRIRFNDSLFVISDMVTSEKKITIDFSVGYDSPAVGTKFYVYNEPFSQKEVKIGIGHNEFNIIYIKGINDDYNILSKDWSAPIMFDTNNLVLAGSNTTLNEYYGKYCYDFGTEMIAKAKQNAIYAYNGITPNAPVLKEEEMKVVQINTQLESTLESETYNNLVSSIYSIKSTVEDLRQTISKNKDTLLKTADDAQRTTIQNKIDTDTESLSSYTTQYNSLVEELNTMLNNNGAIGYSPKYHIRGFFPIPAPKYTDEKNGIGKQEVIGFEIMYRYIHTDNTGVSLDTFQYSTDDNDVVNAVFSDWCTVTSKIKEQVYDEIEGIYVWEDESVTDGNVININQIDIPIRNGEKVQIKARSISEAGYPSNPLKSAWSNTITVSFPENLTANDSVTNVIESTKNDMTAVVLQETLSSAGLYTHISDANSSYKHLGDNIGIKYKSSTMNGGDGKEYYYYESLQVVLDDILTKIEKLQNK